MCWVERGGGSRWQVDEENPMCSIAIKCVYVCVCVFGNSRFFFFGLVFSLQLKYNYS